MTISHTKHQLEIEIVKETQTIKNELYIKMTLDLVTSSCLFIQFNS